MLLYLTTLSIDNVPSVIHGSNICMVESWNGFNNVSDFRSLFTGGIKLYRFC